jgi:hypothetical protein
MTSPAHANQQSAAETSVQMPSAPAEQVRRLNQHSSACHNMYVGYRSQRIPLLAVHI